MWNGSVWQAECQCQSVEPDLGLQREAHYKHAQPTFQSPVRLCSIRSSNQNKQIPSKSLPWAALQGWSVKLCSSVLSLFSICLTCNARNTINPSFDLACPFSFTELSKGQSRRTPPCKGCPFLHCTSRVGDGMRCGNSKSHQEIQIGRIAKTNTPAEICVPVIFSVAHPLKIPKTCLKSSFRSRCYNSTAPQEMIVTTIKPKLAGN